MPRETAKEVGVDYSTNGITLDYSRPRSIYLDIVSFVLKSALFLSSICLLSGLSPATIFSETSSYGTIAAVLAGAFYLQRC